MGTLGEAYAARRYAQETNLAMKGVWAADEGSSRSVGDRSILVRDEFGG